MAEFQLHLPGFGEEEKLPPAEVKTPTREGVARVLPSQQPFSSHGNLIQSNGKDNDFIPPPPGELTILHPVDGDFPPGKIRGFTPPDRNPVFPPDEDFQRRAANDFD